MTHRSIASQERTGCLVTAAAGRAAQAVHQTAETPTLAPTRDSGVTAAVNACRTRDRAEERNRTRVRIVVEQSSARVTELTANRRRQV